MKLLEGAELIKYTCVCVCVCVCVCETISVVVTPVQEVPQRVNASAAPDDTIVATQ